jgi:ferric-chelate reductase
MSATINATSLGPPTPPLLNNPYRGYQLWQREEYPKQIWAFVGTSIGALILCNIIYTLRVWSRKKKLMRKFQDRTTTNDNEKNVTTDVSTSSWQRLLLATEAAFKIVAFRFTVPYGLTAVLSLSEVFLTVGYLTMIMIWNFIYCEPLLRMRESC